MHNGLPTIGRPFKRHWIALFAKERARAVLGFLRFPPESAAAIAAQIPFGAYDALIYGSEMINSPAQPNHGALARLHGTPLRDANAAYQFELVTLLKITSLDAQYFVLRVQ